MSEFRVVHEQMIKIFPKDDEGFWWEISVDEDDMPYVAYFESENPFEPVQIVNLYDSEVIGYVASALLDIAKVNP